MRTLMIMAALASLTACSHAEKLAVCKGPAFALNPDRWQASAADLQLPQPGSTR